MRLKARHDRTDILSKSDNDSLNDFAICCSDGIIRVPKLIMAGLAYDCSWLKDTLLNETDSCLILPDAKIVNVRLLLNAMIGVNEELRLFDQVVLNTFSWIDWKKWMINPQESFEVCTDIVDDILAKVPISMPTDSTTLTSQAKADVSARGGRIIGSFGKKIYKCQICGKILCDRHSLKKHEDAVHFNIRNHGCEFCPKRFSVRNDLNDHVTAVHSKVKVTNLTILIHEADHSHSR